ncbi:glycosyl hydrolase family 61-domain-containing protein [Clohesyomyces aquaticus]|uniref:lytic cellulose monooxygenase (C4-dehydrogenating) n=1 Tax=Clohesyomyces aquaticus TaxID=1231657 RepID=A0A1Y2A646_9PLEO|nr:glycosyl hydrolase family 61-domain-containing protein [Clohesyomyces aquaticus]
MSSPSSPTTGAPSAIIGNTSGSPSHPPSPFQRQSTPLTQQPTRNVTTVIDDTGTYEIAETTQVQAQYDVYSENIRCGRGATVSGPGVQTLPVEAGDEVAFYASGSIHIVNLDGTSQSLDDTVIYHHGPAQAYLSPAGSNIEAYTGDGDWFKITHIGAQNDTRWVIDQAPSINVTIPKTTPPGKYLLRVEHMYLSNARFNSTQFFVNCAQIDVKGTGRGKPGPMVKFPGAYDLFEPAVWGSWNTYYSKNLTQYVGAGPPVWSG